jgi:hypothetical protein
MSHTEAIESANKHVFLVGKKFRLSDGETETIKAVVAWQEHDGEWNPHVCFYDWEKNDEGKILHMKLDDFFRKYQQVKE